MQKRLSIIAIIAALAFGNASQAIKIENFPLATDAHIGIVTGVGVGMNLGFDLGATIKDVIQIGPEFEAVISDVNYSATVNAVRIGGFINYKLSSSFILNFHMGTFNMQSSREFTYSAGGNLYRILEGQNYKGQYTAVSLDYLFGDMDQYMLSPKITINTVNNQGTMNQFDLNLGFRF